MKILLNTLYVQTPGAYLHLDHETLKVEFEGELRLQVPLHHLGGLVLFGEVMASPALMARCAQDGRAIIWLSRSGRYLGRFEGPVSGNVLLRRDQNNCLNQPGKTLELARNLVAGKLHNQRQAVLRSARDTDAPDDQEPLHHTAHLVAEILVQLPQAADIDTLRGMEGDAARHYFATFSHMIRAERDTFAISGRTRRPPWTPPMPCSPFSMPCCSATAWPGPRE